MMFFIFIYAFGKPRKLRIKNQEIFWLRNFLIWSRAQNEKSRDFFILVPEPFQFGSGTVTQWFRYHCRVFNSKFVCLLSLQK